MEYLIMLDLLQQKDILLSQLHHYAETLGLSHPHTVKKSQELDVIINQMVFQDLHMEKRAG
ncbi:MAG: aspartyl-phosphate phosphatase Spo0E family protein [Defluviitaleaceae bacterium]|nr:aspartyl-phosphate phosphatase Spo0E family protein [Defluviitaleaceae bacterium]